MEEGSQGSKRAEGMEGNRCAIRRVEGLNVSRREEVRDGVGGTIVNFTTSELSLTPFPIAFTHSCRKEQEALRKSKALADQRTHLTLRLSFFFIVLERKEGYQEESSRSFHQEG